VVLGEGVGGEGEDLGLSVCGSCSWGRAERKWIGEKLGLREERGEGSGNGRILLGRWGKVPLGRASTSMRERAGWAGPGYVSYLRPRYTGKVSLKKTYMLLI
jgi:hypothetical protein